MNTSHGKVITESAFRHGPVRRSTVAGEFAMLFKLGVPGLDAPSVNFVSLQWSNHVLTFRSAGHFRHSYHSKIGHFLEGGGPKMGVPLWRIIAIGIGARSFDSAS